MKYNHAFLKPVVIWPIILAAAFVIFMIGINHESIWFDETYSLAMVQHDFARIIAYTAYDVHPPLYYFICTHPEPPAILESRRRFFLAWY